MLSAPLDPNPLLNFDAGPKTRVLVADDDIISRELLSTRLTKWGYDVITAHNGNEAMETLEGRDAPTLVILDWMMPGMDGLSICRRIRQAGSNQYVIMVTARGTKENIVEGLAAGADDYLVKPFDKDDLRMRVLVGQRVIALQETLADRLLKLDAANEEIGNLRRRDEN